MSTRLYLHTTTSPIDTSHFRYSDITSAKMNTTIGSGTGFQYQGDSTANGTEILWGIDGPGSQIQWVSNRMAGDYYVTQARYYLWAYEDSDLNNVGLRVRIFHYSDLTGSIVELTGGPFDTGIELTTTNTSYLQIFNFSAGEQFYKNDRIIFRVYLTNVGGSMRAGTNWLSFDGNNGSNSYLQITQDIQFYDWEEPYKSKFYFGESVGRLPSGNDINLDSYGEFKKLLNWSVEGGSLSTNTVVSTYPLSYTTSSAYNGGVLSSNNEIHFVPYQSAIGQKINMVGTTSTYPLIYGGGYTGGVLGPNGDIHFIPRAAPVGQKVNSSGVVSTYTLVYTSPTYTGYGGGIVNPLNEIHFIPMSANVGQKISISGVVSTYTLTNTLGSAMRYYGGVLSPNGEIHCVPLSATVGQKITGTGVTSTYSLVYTATDAYSGGVLSPNGDIHFVPYTANRGQKIDINGVVSTYSLAYTTLFAYYGGVLSPNGDVHFIPLSATVGQKIDINGVVSTYPLIYTTSAAYAGGILFPNGDIQMIPSSANRGQKITTQSSIPFGIGVCCSPFFNKY